MRSLLDYMLDNVGDGARLDNVGDGTRVISEQHDLSKIQTGGDPSDPTGIKARIASLKNGGPWDATEYGISREEQIARLEAADTPEAQEKAMAELRQRAVRRAALDVTGGRVRAAFAGKPAWHGLGTVFDDVFTSEQGIVAAGLDWPVEKVRYSYDFNGQRRESPDAFAVIRTDTGAHLGTVGSRYTPIQNKDGFAFLDDMLKEHGARYESAGSVFGGRRVWMLAHMPKQRFSVNGGDEQEPYVIFTNCHDGSGAANCLPTAVRTECANTLRIALRKKGKGLSIRHTGDVKSKIASARSALGLAVKGFEQYRQAAEQMVKTPCDIKAYASDILEAVFTVTEARQISPLDGMLAEYDAQQELDRKARERAKEAQKVALQDILKRYDSERCHPRGTLWAAFNAVTEHADHHTPKRQPKGDEARLSRRFDSVLTGEADDLKQAAYQRAVALMR